MEWWILLVLAMIVLSAILPHLNFGSEKPRPSGVHGDAEIATTEMLAAAGLIGRQWGEGIRLGITTREGAVIRFAGQNSITVVAPPGAGKQTTFATAALIEAQQTAFFVLDPKLELLPICHRRRAEIGPVRWIVPFKEGLPPELAHYVDESDSYNPLYFLDPKSESFVINCDSLAEILVAPDGSGETKDSGFFTGNAQAALAGVIMQLVENYRDRATLPEAASIICSNRIWEFAATAMKTGSQYVRDRVAVLATPDAPLLKGGVGDILRTLREQLRWLSNPAIARVMQTPKKPWRFDDLKHGPNPGTFFVGVSAKYLPTCRRLFRLLLGCAVSELQTTPPGKWQVCCLADEFALLGRVPIFQTVFAEARGHGFNMIAMVQNIGQLIATYGQEGYRNILSGSQIQLYMAPRDIQTAQEISRMAGKRTVVTEHRSFSDDGRKGTIGYPEIAQDVLTPHQAMALKPDEFIMFAPGLLKDAYIGYRWPYWESYGIAPLCDPNPYNPAVPVGLIEVTCPHCRVGGAVPRSLLRRLLGVPVKCGRCGKNYKIDELPEDGVVVVTKAGSRKAYVKRKLAEERRNGS
jgi:type IV secretory pathway TraG/TraD family ATPase VirD4